MTCRPISMERLDGHGGWMIGLGGWVGGGGESECR